MQQNNYDKQPSELGKFDGFYNIFLLMQCISPPISYITLC
jgi:hypothetical protein